MNDGRVEGFGTHDELLNNNSIYRDVYDAQTNGGGDFDEGGAN
jgi:ATP-binding cassette subfamily B protein